MQSSVRYMPVSLSTLPVRTVSAKCCVWLMGVLIDLETVWQSQPCCQFYPSHQPRYHFPHRRLTTGASQTPQLLLLALSSVVVVVWVSSCHLCVMLKHSFQISSWSRLENRKQPWLTAVPTIQHCHHLSLHFSPARHSVSCSSCMPLLQLVAKPGWFCVWASELNLLSLNYSCCFLWWCVSVKLH